MNDYLGNLVARSHNAPAVLRPQLAHPYETPGERSAPVAAPYPDERAPGLTAEEQNGAPPAWTATTGEAVSSARNEAPSQKSSPERDGSGPTGLPRQGARRGAVRGRARDESTPGEPPRSSPETTPTPPRSETQSGVRVMPSDLNDTTEPPRIPEVTSPAQANEPGRQLAPNSPARPQAAPTGARPKPRPEASGLIFFHAAAAAEGAEAAAAEGAEAAAHVLHAEASLAPSTHDARAAGPDAASRRDAKVLPILVMSAPAESELTMPAVPEPPAPVIRVTIGRVEVRAVTPPPPPAPARKPARPAPRMSLDEYLRSQRGGRG